MAINLKFDGELVSSAEFTVKLPNGREISGVHVFADGERKPYLKWTDQDRADLEASLIVRCAGVPEMVEANVAAQCAVDARQSADKVAAAFKQMQQALADATPHVEACAAIAARAEEVAAIAAKAAEANPVAERKE